MILVICPVKRPLPTSQCRDAEGRIGIKMYKIRHELEEDLYAKSAGIYVSVI